MAECQSLSQKSGIREKKRQGQGHHPDTETQRKARGGPLTGWFMFFLMACILGAASWSPPVLHAVSMPVGTVEMVEGMAFLRHELQKSATRIQTGDKIYPRDEITTQSGAKVKITFVTRSTIHLGGDSHLIIRSVLYAPQKSLNRSFFKLPIGKIRAVVEKFSSPDSKFEVETKTAVAGVVGTREIITAGPDPETGKDITQTVCEEGHVAVRSSDPQIQGEIILDPLEQSFTRENEAPEDKVKISREQLEEMIRETTIAPSEKSPDKTAGSLKKDEKKKEKDDKAEGKNTGEKKEAGEKKDTGKKEETTKPQENNKGEPSARRAHIPPAAGLPGPTGAGRDGPAETGQDGQVRSRQTGTEDSYQGQAQSRQPDGSPGEQYGQGEGAGSLQPEGEASDDRQGNYPTEEKQSSVPEVKDNQELEMSGRFSEPAASEIKIPENSAFLNLEKDLPDQDKELHGTQNPLVDPDNLNNTPGSRMPGDTDSPFARGLMESGTADVNEDIGAPESLAGNDDARIPDPEVDPETDLGIIPEEETELLPRHDDIIMEKITEIEGDFDQIMGKLPGPPPPPE